MKILLVTDSYPPEIRSASHLMAELAQELHQRQHQVVVATTWPQYNIDEQTKLDDMAEITDDNGVTVLRIKTLPHHNVSYIVRGLSQLLQPRTFLKKLKQHNALDFDAVIIYSPPLPLALLGAWFKKNKPGTKVLLNIQDLFPQNAIDLGILKNRMLIKLFQWIEKRSYKHADIITTHSQGNKVLLQSMYPSIKEKVTVLHNWVDVSFYQEQHIKARSFVEEWSLSNRVVAVFAGVVGPSQNLKFVIDVFKRLPKHKLTLLIVGDGAEKAALQAYVAQEKLDDTVLFKPFINKTDYRALLQVCDFGVVSLSSKNKTPVVPGKLLGYMAAAVPVLAFLNKESDGHELIKKASCGFSCDSVSVEKASLLLEQFLQQSDQKTAFYGKAGLEYVSKNFSKEEIITKLEQMLA